MHSHWNNLRLMHYDVYATPNMLRGHDLHDLSKSVTSTCLFYKVFACFNVCTSSQHRWAWNWVGFRCTEWHCCELYRSFLEPLEMHQQFVHLVSGFQRFFGGFCVSRNLKTRNLETLKESLKASRKYLKITSVLKSLIIFWFFFCLFMSNHSS